MQLTGIDTVAYFFDTDIGMEVLNLPSICGMVMYESEQEQVCRILSRYAVQLKARVE